MAEFIGAFGYVSEVKAVKSLGLTRIVIEMPIENHKKATQAFFDEHVILTLGKHENGRYGVFSPDSEPESESEKQPEKSIYKELFKFGWFNNPQVLKAFGTDKDYQNFVRSQPSCASGKFDYTRRDGVGSCEFAHVRRVSSGAGTGIKPEYSGVPLTHEEHMRQHSEGESAFGSSDFFDKQSVKYRQLWIKSIIYEYFSVESLSDIPHDVFLSFLGELGIENTTPASAKSIFDSIG